jgi:dihydrofolate synthase/folylpolyglutamate synthase
LDATNVIPSKVTVLTSVGLDHTEWLGDTVAEIAAEKLAVLRDHSVLVTGPDPSSWVEPVVEEFVADRHARWVIAEPAGPNTLPAFQRRNLGLALAATEVLVGDGEETSPAVDLSEFMIPGRLEVLAGEPPVVLDVAHNPDAARALAEALPAVCEGGPVVCCLAILDDKDASGMIEALAGVSETFVCTEIAEDRMAGTGRPGAKCVPASELAAACERFGVASEIVSDPAEAIVRSREIAHRNGGVAVVTGSHYLLRTYGQRSEK